MGPPRTGSPVVNVLKIDGRVFPVTLAASFGPLPLVYVYPLGPYTRLMVPAHAGLRPSRLPTIANNRPCTRPSER